MKYRWKYLELSLIYLFVLAPRGNTMDVYKPNDRGDFKKVPLNFSRDCPKIIDLSLNDPLYKVEVSRGCDDQRLCPITFKIPDKLQAASLEVCGDLESINIGNCTGDKSVSLAKRDYHIIRHHWKFTIKYCSTWVWKNDKCRSDFIQLLYSGLEPCDNFGEATVFVKSIYSNIHYLDSPDQCSVKLPTIPEKVPAGIQSQHSLSQNSQELPEHCEVTMATHKLIGRHKVCIYFPFVDFNCSLNLTIEDVNTGSEWLRFDCHLPPVLNNYYCRTSGHSEQSYKVIVTRDRNSEESGAFSLAYFSTALPSVTTTEIPSDTTPTASATEDNSDLSQTIAISISVLVAVCLLIIGIKCLCSSRSSICKWKEEEVPMSDLNNVRAEPVPVTTTSTGRLTPTAPLVYQDSNLQNSVNMQPQPYSESVPADIPPPKYDTLFPES